jgi:hypothetical protein
MPTPVTWHPNPRRVLTEAHTRLTSIRPLILRERLGNHPI